MAALFIIIDINFFKAYAFFVSLGISYTRFEPWLKDDLWFIRLRNWQFIHLVVLLGHVPIKFFDGLFIEDLEIWQTHQ